MLTTTQQNLQPTMSLTGGGSVRRCPDDLMQRYDALVKDKRATWTEHYALRRLLGSGGQGVVYLTERRGANGFTLPLAIKIFSPERFESFEAYEDAMARAARVGARVARIQQHNLLEIHNFLDANAIRVLVMEWVDGYDLQILSTPGMVERIRPHISDERWEYVNEVIVTKGIQQPRFKPGVAVAIMRDCLAALAALHRHGIVHADVKPSNIMLKRTGAAKLIDIGSAFEMDNTPESRTCTPAYAAPEVLEGDEATPRSDLASLGYVLIEMLSGQSLFGHVTKYAELTEAKRALSGRLLDIMPDEVSCNELLMNFCRRLIATEPGKRFPSAEDADFRSGGAASFHRQLVKGDLASEYDNEIRLWIEELQQVEFRDQE